jgi:hypothetical protein
MRACRQRRSTIRTTGARWRTRHENEFLAAASPPVDNRLPLIVLFRPADPIRMPSVG